MKKKDRHWWHRRRSGTCVCGQFRNFKNIQNAKRSLCVGKLCAKIQIKCNIFLLRAAVTAVFPRDSRFAKSLGQRAEPRTEELEITCNYQTHGLICKCFTFTFFLLFYAFCCCSFYTTFSSPPEINMRKNSACLPSARYMRKDKNLSIKLNNEVWHHFHIKKYFSNAHSRSHIFALFIAFDKNLIP